MRVDALEGDLTHHAERPQPDARQPKQPWLGFGRQLNRAERRRDERHSHHLLVHGRDGRAGAVGPHLDEAANLLLGDRGIVLQGQPVRPEGLHHLLDTGAGADRHLLALRVDRDNGVALRHVEHRAVAQPEPVGAERRAYDSHASTRLVHPVQDPLHSGRRVGLEVQLRRCLVCGRPVGDHLTARAAQLIHRRLRKREPCGQ
mmetsp:Transcript_13909/g.45538  ORF Transcript_13909/g.45538 Transcript_13909/m.45538 type:complete len:202 (-) Transcript_13909:637-1242(-)